MAYYPVNNYPSVRSLALSQRCTVLWDPLFCAGTERPGLSAVDRDGAAAVAVFAEPVVSSVEKLVSETMFQIFPGRCASSL